MPKTKVVPIELEKEFVALSEQKDALDKKYALVKKQVLSYYERGYGFKMIYASDTSAGRVSIPWQKVAMWLMKKYMRLPEINKLMAALRKKHKKEVAPSFKPLRKKVEDESLV